MMNWNKFETSIWKEMSVEQRVDALQELEISMADEQGRQPRIVQPSDLSNTTRGQYSPLDPNNLHINKKLIERNNGNYQAMQTIIHEGRHAYQDDCITKKVVPQSEDQSNVVSWAHNMPGRGGVYNSNSFTEYRYQPVEADANTYAKDKINSLGNLYCNDTAFSEFCAKRDMQEKYTSNVAKSTYGSDYEQVIKQDIDRRYQQVQQQTNEISSQEKNIVQRDNIDSKRNSGEQSKNEHDEVEENVQEM